MNRTAYSLTGIVQRAGSEIAINFLKSWSALHNKILDVEDKLRRNATVTEVYNFDLGAASTNRNNLQGVPSTLAAHPEAFTGTGEISRNPMYFGLVQLIEKAALTVGVHFYRGSRFFSTRMALRRAAILGRSVAGTSPNVLAIS